MLASRQPKFKFKAIKPKFKGYSAKMTMYSTFNPHITNSAII